MGKAMIVHELAHAWDHASYERGAHYPIMELFYEYRSLSQRMEEATQGGKGQRASEYANASREEDWAEAVAAMVYPNARNYRTYDRETRIYTPNIDQTRACFVRAQFEGNAREGLWIV
jgi:hypothetical protein